MTSTASNTMDVPGVSLNPSDTYEMRLLLAILLLVLPTFGQRPVGDNPFGDIPSVAGWWCHPGETGPDATVPDPACLEQALLAYYNTMTPVINTAQTQWDVAKATYESAVAAADAAYESCVAQCGTDQYCITVCGTIQSNSYNAAYATFSSTSAGIWSTYDAAYRAAHDAFNAAVTSCCTDIDTVTPATHTAPRIPCLGTTTPFVLCSDGSFPEANCYAVCELAYISALSIKCNELNAELDTLYWEVIEAAKLGPAGLIKQAYYDAFFGAIEEYEAYQVTQMQTFLSCVQGCC